MPKATPFQESFTGGEASPLVYGRVTSPRYKQSLERCLNYLPTLQGALGRRPGTKYLNNVKDSTNPGVLIPFTFSTTQAYMLEFGANYIRFYANGGQIVTAGTIYKFSGGTYHGGLRGFSALRSTNTYQTDESGGSITTISTPGTILELPSPYAVNDLPRLRWTQDADTLYLFHPAYPTAKLQRVGQTQWEFRQVAFSSGPYLPVDSYASIGDSTNITLQGTSIFGIGQSIVKTGPTLTVSGMVTDPALSGKIQVTTSTNHGYVTGQKIFIANVVGTTEANNNNSANALPTHPYSWTITVTGLTTFLLQGSTFANAYVSGGSINPAFWFADVGTGTTPDVGRNFGIVISGVRSDAMIQSVPDVATIIVYGDAIPTALGTAWYLGVYSLTNGYPACGCFHQNRLVIAGAPGSPQEIDGSVVGDYENFSPASKADLTVVDSDAYSFQLASREVNVIRWLLSSAQGLLAGSYSAEWAITPSSAAAALTPTNFNAQQTSFFGAADVDAVQSGNAAIYVQRAGRKVREMNYFFQVGTFRSTDMTEISEHITIPTVIKLAVQKETQPLVWAVRSDGVLISMLYNRDDATLQAGWTAHTLGGQSDSGGTAPVVLSIGFIPDPTAAFDQMWLLVRRYINGSTIVAVEYMTKFFDDSILKEDAFQLDCGSTYDTPLTITAITSANPAVVTSAAHGLIAGNEVKLTSVVGLNLRTTDINGNVTLSNLVNEKTFVVGTVTTNTFQLKDHSGNNIDSTSFSAYVSGGQARKLVTTISGLTWLENETVGILADGGIHKDVVVSNSGVVTLDIPSAKVQIGYRYNSDGKQLRAEAGAAAGSSMGSIRRTSRAAMLVHSIGDLSIGTEFTSLIPIQIPEADNAQANVPPELFSGMLREGVESKYDFESQICWRQNSALPGIINGITSFMEEYDV